MHRLTFEQERKLIDYFRDHPSLWNTKDKDYNNRSLRTDKLEIIAGQLGLTRKDVYEKYRNLRTTFFREHKRVTKTSTNSGGDAGGGGRTNQPYRSRWRHYENMLFLTTTQQSNSGQSLANGASVGDHVGSSESSTILVTIGSRPGSTNTTTANEEKFTPPASTLSSLQNGHDLELMDRSSSSSTTVAATTMAGGNNSNTAAAHQLAGDEFVVINQSSDQDGGVTTAALAAIQLTNVGIIGNHQTQRILTTAGISSGNNSMTTTVAPAGSTLPFSVIHATATANQTQFTPVLRGVKVEHSDSGHQFQQQQQTILIKNPSGSFHVHGSPILATPSGGSVSAIPSNVSTNTASIGAGQQPTATFVVANSGSGSITLSKQQQKATNNVAKHHQQQPNQTFLGAAGSLSPNTSVHLVSLQKQEQNSTTTVPMSPTATTTTTSQRKNGHASSFVVVAAPPPPPPPPTIAGAVANTKDHHSHFHQNPRHLHSPTITSQIQMLRPNDQHSFESMIINQQQQSPQVLFSVPSTPTTQQSTTNTGSLTTPISMNPKVGQTTLIISANNNNANNNNLGQQQQLNQTTPVHQHHSLVQHSTPLMLNNNGSSNSNSSSNSSGIFCISGTSGTSAGGNSSSCSNSSSILFHGQTTPTSGSSNNISTTLCSNPKVLDYGEMREVIKTVVQEAIVEYEDEEMAFCRSLAASLRTLDRSNKDVVKLELQQVIVRYTNPGYSGIIAGSSSLSSTTTQPLNQDTNQHSYPKRTTPISANNTFLNGPNDMNNGTNGVDDNRPKETTANTVSTIVTAPSCTTITNKRKSSDCIDKNIDNDSNKKNKQVASKSTITTTNNNNNNNNRNSVKKDLAKIKRIESESNESIASMKNNNGDRNSDNNDRIDMD